MNQMKIHIIHLVIDNNRMYKVQDMSNRIIISIMTRAISPIFTALNQEIGHQQ